MAWRWNGQAAKGMFFQPSEHNTPNSGKASEMGDGSLGGMPFWPDWIQIPEITWLIMVI